MGITNKTSVVCLPPLTSVRDPAGLNPIHEKLCITTEVEDLLCGVHVNFCLQVIPPWQQFWRRDDNKGKNLKHVLMLNAAVLILTNW
jgi:hypothetical protein